MATLVCSTFSVHPLPPVLYFQYPASYPTPIHSVQDTSGITEPDFHGGLGHMLVLDTVVTPLLVNRRILGAGSPRSCFSVAQSAHYIHSNAKDGSLSNLL